jgi:hypothetical protein
MVLEQLTNGEKLSVAGGALAVVAAILPWWSAGFLTASGLDGDGIFTMIFGAVAVAIGLFRDWQAVDIGAIGVIGVMTVLVGWNNYSSLNRIAEIANTVNISAGVGLHLTMLSGLLLIGAAVYGYARSGHHQRPQMAGDAG